MLAACRRRRIRPSPRRAHRLKRAEPATLVRLLVARPAPSAASIALPLSAQLRDQRHHRVAIAPPSRPEASPLLPLYKYPLSSSSLTPFSLLASSLLHAPAVVPRTFETACARVPSRVSRAPRRLATAVVSLPSLHLSQLPPPEAKSEREREGEAGGEGEEKKEGRKEKERWRKEKKGKEKGKKRKEKKEEKEKRKRKGEKEKKGKK